MQDQAGVKYAILKVKLEQYDLTVRSGRGTKKLNNWILKTQEWKNKF